MLVKWFFFEKKMNFDITILGCGSALPVKHRNPTSQIVSIANSNYMIDCGEGTQLAVRNNHIKLQNLKAIFISHLHGDHYLGLMGLISSLSLLGRTKPLSIFSPKGLEEIILLQLKLSGSYLQFDLTFTEVGFEGLHNIYEDKKVEVFSFPLKHRIPCSGYKFVEKPKEPNIIKSKINFYKIPLKEIKFIKRGADFIDQEGKLIPNENLVIPPRKSRSYAFCSDTIYNETIIPWIHEVDLLYHESTFLEELKFRAIKTMHSTAIDAANIAKLAKVKKLVLGHYSARYIELDEFIEEAQPIFKNVHVANDNEVYNIL